MPRLKNSRRPAKRKKAKAKLVVAMVSKKSLLSQKKREAEQEPETEANIKGEAIKIRPKRAKPAKRFIEEESQKHEPRKKRAAKKPASKGRKKVTKSPAKAKAAKRKIKVEEDEEIHATKQPKVQDVEEMGAEFHGLDDFDHLEPQADIEMLVVTTPSRQKPKTVPKSRPKKKSAMNVTRDQAGQIVIDNAHGSMTKQDSEDDDDDAHDEDDDDIDDSLFFGIPSERE